jgi:hypothetical protein
MQIAGMRIDTALRLSGLNGLPMDQGPDGKNDSRCFQPDSRAIAAWLFTLMKPKSLIPQPRDAIFPPAQIPDLPEIQPKCE